MQFTRFPPSIGINALPTGLIEHPNGMNTSTGSCFDPQMSQVFSRQGGSGSLPNFFRKYPAIDFIYKKEPHLNEAREVFISCWLFDIDPVELSPRVDPRSSSLDNQLTQVLPSHERVRQPASPDPFPRP